MEKLEWEAKVSSTKVEELEVDVASMDVEISALMKVFRKITENNRASYPTDTSDDSLLECEPVQLDVSSGLPCYIPRNCLTQYSSTTCLMKM